MNWFGNSYKLESLNSCNRHYKLVRVILKKEETGTVYVIRDDVRMLFGFYLFIDYLELRKETYLLNKKRTSLSTFLIAVMQT